MILYIFYCLLTFCPFLTDVNQDPPKRANTIIIKTSDNIDAAFKNTGRLLMNNGYELDQVEKTFYVITTRIANKKYGMGGMGSLEMKLQIQFDTVDEYTLITITGKVNSAELNRAAGGSSGKFDRDASTIENRGMNGSILKDSWVFMNELAMKYQKGILSYKIVNK